MFGLDAGRVFALERPEHAVEDVAAHVADGAVAEIIPAVPLVRMQVVVEVTVRRRADPFVPVQAGRNGKFGRARPLATVGAIGPAVRLGDFANDTRPNVFAELVIAIFAMALIAHLRRDFGLRRHRPHGAGLANVMADGLLAIDVLAQLHGNHGGQGVMMVWRGDEHGVHSIADLVEHLPVIGEDRQRVGIAALALEPFLHDGVPVLLHIDNGDEMLVFRGGQVRGGAASATADLDEADLLAGVGGV